MKIRLSAEQLIYYLVFAAFLSMPLGTSPPVICGALAALVWILSGKPIKLRRAYLAQSWFWPVLLFIILHWVGLLYSPDPGGMGIGFAKKTHYWLYGLAAASISFAIFSPEKLIQAYLVGLAINALVAIIQLIGIFPVKNELAYGLGLGYSTMAAYLVLGILMASFYFRETEEKRTRILLGVLMAGYFFHLIILMGRVGFLTFFILSPLIIRNVLRRFSLFKISLVYVLLIGLMSLSPIVRDRVSLTLNQIKHHLNADPGSAWGREYTIHQDRFYMWYGAVQIFLENPLFGVGTGGYTNALKERGKPEWPAIAHPHSNLFYMAVSFGLIGIFALVWFFWEMIRNAWEERNTPLGYFVLSTALVIIVSGLVDTQIMDSSTALLLSLATGLQNGFPKFACLVTPTPVSSQPCKNRRTGQPRPALSTPKAEEH
jgi:O-antigen ligase